MLRAIDALVSLTSSIQNQDKSIEERKEFYNDILSINDNSLFDLLTTESGWLLPLITDSLKSAENFEYFSNILERLFTKLIISVHKKDLQMLAINMGILVDIAIKIFEKDNSESSIAALKILEYIIQIFQKVKILNILKY